MRLLDIFQAWLHTTTQSWMLKEASVATSLSFQLWLLIAVILRYINPEISLKVTGINPFVTGNTTLCDWILETVDNITVHIVHIFIQNFLGTLKRTLEILQTFKEMFSRYIPIVVSGSWTNDHRIFLMRIPPCSFKCLMTSEIWPPGLPPSWSGPY